MLDVAAFAKKTTAALVPLLRVGLGTLAKTLLLGQFLTFVAMLLAGIVGSRHGEFSARIVSALLVGFIGTVATLFLASKRAVFGVLEAALEKLAMGTALFQVVFTYLLGVTDGTERGERLGALGSTLETRIPLVQAEQRLTAAVARVTLEKHELTGLRGWLMTKVRASLLERVEQVTLTRFRKDGQNNGAIDLVQVKDELGQGLDAMLIDQARNLSSRSTWLFFGLATAMAAFTTWSIHHYW